MGHRTPVTGNDIMPRCTVSANHVSFCQLSLCFCPHHAACPADMVEKFLMSKDIPAADSRLKDSFTPATVSTWLTVFSKCGLEQLVQLCIDYIVSQETNVDIDMANLQPTHANMLFAATQRKLISCVLLMSKTNSELRHANLVLSQHLPRLRSSGALTAYSCSACNRKWISRNSYTVCCDKMTSQTKIQLYVL